MVIVPATLPPQVEITEVGDCENPGNWKTDGQRAKDAVSDGLKRTAMRLGLGLHLWVGDRNYFLDAKLAERDDQRLALDKDLALLATTGTGPVLTKDQP